MSFKIDTFYHKHELNIWASKKNWKAEKFISSSYHRSSYFLIKDFLIYGKVIRIVIALRTSVSTWEIEDILKNVN